MKQTKASRALVLAFALVFNTFAAIAQQSTSANQTPPAAPSAQDPQRPANDEEVVRITTNLVQVDVTVTDKQGRHVPDLQASDFEIYEDGKPQTITNFSYITSALSAPPNQPAAASPKSNDKLAPPVPPMRPRPEQVRRTMAIVVDDLGLSFESAAYVRQALKKFVDTQIQPGDLVAIIRTSAGVGALQQFTTDRQQLCAAIERVRWNPNGRAGISPFAPIEYDPVAAANQQSRSARGSNSDSVGDDPTESAMGNPGQSLEEFREDLFAVGTLGALNYVVRGLKELPGRKSIVLFSEGFRFTTSDDPEDSSPNGTRFKYTNPRVFDALRRLTDLALRSSVVIYTVDARGLQTLNFTAADSAVGRNPQQIQQALSARRDFFFETQDSLRYLAEETGGLAFINNNDLFGGMRRALEDQQGYYLIAYRPDEKTFDPKNRNFHQWKVRVRNHPELTVRYRKGFYGFTESEAKPVARTRSQQLIAALTSPFGAGGVELRLTSLFGNDAKLGSFVRSVMYIKGSDLTFTDEPDGWRKTVFDVMAVTFGDNGAVINEVNRTETIRARGDVYQEIMRHGLLYNISVPVKKAGAYQLRVAVRDASTEKVGAASQFIEAPDISKNHLALSDLIVYGNEPQEAKTANASAPQQAQKSNALESKEGAAQSLESDEESQASPALRRIKRGMSVDYAFYVYNAQIDKSSGRPQVQTQMRLFRDGKLVFTSQPHAVNTQNQTDMKRLGVINRFQLSPNAQPGEYVLQVVATDMLAKEKYRTATRWIDFEVVK